MRDRALEFLICDCAMHWRKRYTTHTAHLKLIGLERRIILILQDQPNISQVTLAEAIEQEPQTLTRVLDRLEEKNLIQKTPGKKDRRAKYLSLTTKGKKLYQKIMGIADTLRPTILAEISSKEISQLSKTLEKIKRNLS